MSTFYLAFIKLYLLDSRWRATDLFLSAICSSHFASKVMVQNLKCRTLIVVSGSNYIWLILLLQGPKMMDGNFPTSFPLKHERKDLELVLQLAKSNNLTLPIADATTSMFKKVSSSSIWTSKLACNISQTINDNTKLGPAKDLFQWPSQSRATTTLAACVDSQRPYSYKVTILVFHYLSLQRSAVMP